MTHARTNSVVSIRSDQRPPMAPSTPLAVVSGRAARRKGEHFRRRLHLLAHSPFVADIQRHSFEIGLVIAAVLVVVIPLATRGVVWMPNP